MLGEVIHGYRIDRALAADKGGFGDVYFATHVESGAEAVVKVLKPEMSALRDMVARFFNEARAAASIHHPGIVQIHNVGYHGDRAYLLMERLRGDDLETRLRSGPLPVDRAIVFLRQTAGAIGAAHERGIVHRDLKPANLFIVADPDVIGGERVKVLDFGIAKLTADTGAGKTQGVFGTPPYMSPEQCASTGAVDARADLYSLGCIFYELVCGRPPFGHGGLELIAAHLRDTPVPPRAIAPWLPPAVEQVILGLLEKQPDRRIPSCAALIAALDAAALSSRMAAGSTPHLPSTAPAVGASSSTTLGSAAAAMSALPPRKRRLAPWLGAGALVVAGGVFAAVMAARDSSTVAGDGTPPVITSDAGIVTSLPADAALVEEITPDAAPVAVAIADAALTVAPDAASVVVATSDTTFADPSDPTEAAVPRETGSAKPKKPTRVGPAAATLTPIRSKDAEESARLEREATQMVLADTSRMEEALPLLEKAAALSSNPWALYKIGYIRFHLGHFGVAEVATRASLAMSPPEPLAGRAKRLLDRIHQEAKAQGITLSSQGSTSGSGADRTSTSRLERARDVAPTSPSEAPNEQVAKLNEAGKAEMYADRYEEALSLFRRAYEIEPSASLLLSIGTAEYQLGRCRDARRTVQRVIATWPSEPPAKKARQLLDKIGTCS